MPDVLSFGTICSGIEGAAVAFEPLGWRHAYAAEIEPFCRDLLDHHYPGVPNLGDITEATDFPAVDLIVAGTPCQSFSLAGNRSGMADARGRLALRFVEIIDSGKPRWIIWENVPGVLSANRGHDFAAFIGALAECGYGFAWRVLDARRFGVAQRRRRVFVVGSRHGYRSAAAVLFDPPTCGKDAKPTRQSGPGRQRASNCAAELLGWTGDTTPKFGVEVCPTLRASQGGEGVGIIRGGLFRRLTVNEWERLQGFPLGYTAIPGWGETARRKAIGNSFAVPVMRWIGERLAFVDDMAKTAA